MEQSSMVFQKDGKNYLQLDCENAKELSMKLGEKTYPFTKDGKKWILELPFSTAVNSVQICVDGQEVLLPELPIGSRGKNSADRAWYLLLKSWHQGCE